MSSTAYKDCLVYPYSTFKEQLKAVEDIKKEIKRRYGRHKKFDLFVLDNCVMAEYKSQTMKDKKIQKYYH